MKIQIKNSVDSWYEWEPTQGDADRSQALFGKGLDAIESLSLDDLCRLLFEDAPEPLTPTQQLLLLAPYAPFKGRMGDRPQTVRKVPGRMGYGAA